MGKITLEQAELSPQREKFNLNYNYHNRESVRWIYRFINSWVGKPYNLAYSKFLEKIEKDRKLKAYPLKDDLIRMFKDELLKTCPWHDCREWEEVREGYFWVNSHGLICKSRKPKDKPKIYKEYIYRLNLKDSVEKCWFIQMCGSYATLEKALKGFTIRERMFDECFQHKEQFADKVLARRGWFRYGQSWTSLWDQIPVGKPEKPYTKNERKQMHAESQDAYKKELRALEKHSEAVYENAMRLDKERIKREREENIITRDRLGFDERSFKK